MLGIFSTDEIGVSDDSLNLFLDRIETGLISEKESEKFGSEHLGQIHKQLDVLKSLYCLSLMPQYFMWTRELQESQHIALWFLAMALSDIPHGNFTGPGFVSMSPLIASNRNIHRKI